MEALILYKHAIEVGIYDGGFSGNLIINQSHKIIINDKTIYGFICKSCDDFLNEYKSDYYYDKVIFFCVSGSNIGKNIFGINLNEFYQFHGLILIGTKSEIISYISQKYNSLENDCNYLKQSKDSDNKKKEKIIDQIKNELEKEKSEKITIQNQLYIMNQNNKNISDELNKEKFINSGINFEIEELKKEKQNLIQKNDNLTKDLESKKNNNILLKNKLDNISSENNRNIERVLKQFENEKNLKTRLESKLQLSEKKEKEQNMKIEELGKKLEQKEKENKSLTYSKKELTNYNEKLEQKINIKEKEIKEINNLLKNEKKNNENITKILKNEQYKNQQLNDKLDNISIENNRNVQVILEELQNVKQEKKNLETKYFELQRKENQNSIKNKKLENS
jgi:hypothetical protein